MGDLHLEQLLESARAARARGDGRACLQRLREAQQAAEDTERLVTVSWRRAKAEVDFGDAQGLLACLAPILAAEDPFAGSDAALGATEAIVRRIWDDLGYGSALPGQLLSHASAAWLARGDQVRSLWVDVQRAWELACIGDVDSLQAETERVERIRPRDLRGSKSRHARAEDAESSLAWLQLDLSRTWTRCATWMRDHDSIEQALEALADAEEAAGLQRRADPWHLEALLAAQRVAGRTASEDDLRAWERALSVVEAPRRVLHDALRRALLGNEPFLPVADLAASSRLGAEWQAWPLQEAALAGEEGAHGRLSRIIADAGLRAFTIPS